MTTSPKERASGSRDVFAGGGEMAELARRVDWADTAIGPPESWPQSLRTAVSICLASRFPQLIWWGPELVQIYNDGYRPVLGAKHPRSMGQRGTECWAEVWEVLGPFYEQVRDTAESTWSEDLLLVMERHGFTEETYFTFSYSAIRDESGAVGGVLVTCVETTDRVLGERRLDTLRALGAEAAEARSPEQACRDAAEILARNPLDFPFALFYLLEPDEGFATLAGTAGLEGGGPASPVQVSLTGDPPSPWPLARVAATGEFELVEGLSEQLGELPAGPWHHDTEVAGVVPVARPGQARPAAILVAGVSPALELDDAYRTFLELAAAQVATAIASAEAYAEERRRAEMLAELDRAKTTFFSNVSHEFRTPLTLILAPLEEALDRGAEGVGREELESMHRNALRLLRLVNTLLDFSRIEAGRITASYQPTDMAAMTRDLASAFRSALDHAGIELRLDLPPLGEPVYVDREMWEKVVLNLVSNAFKHTFTGFIEVALRAVDGSAELDVRDTGVGIPEDQVAHVFERFHRVKGARSRSHEGSGIGLALVRELVTLHGGTISVESREGEGSTFTVRLPLGTEHLPEDRIREETEGSGSLEGTRPFVEEALRWIPESTGAPTAPSETDADASQWTPPGTSPGRGTASDADAARVLLADDNADLREYLGRLLGQHWRVEVVDDGAAALEAARRDPPDLVLADVMMPEMDGFELLSALRRDPRLRGAPVILLSARAGEEARVEGLDAGADDYVVKPFSARELLARVRSHLEMARVRREAAAERERLLNREQAARQAAEEANRSKAQFLATMSHELRTPLNAILGYGDLLDAEVAGPLTEGQRTQLERIEAASRHLLHIIEEILSFSRIEAGKEEVHPERVDLSALARETAGLVEPMAEAAGLPLRVLVPETPVEVRSDPGKIRQIVLNLLSNAVKFTREGEVALEVRMGDDETEIRVSDTGVGIPANELDRVFEPFRQVSHRQTDPASGSGLGLAVSRQLTRLLGGELEVESEEGRGSLFTLRIPRSRPGS